MAPTPQTCLVPACVYKTAATLPTYEMVHKDPDSEETAGSFAARPRGQGSDVREPQPAPGASAPSHSSNHSIVPGNANNLSQRFPNTKDPSLVSTTTVPATVTDTITEDCEARAAAPHPKVITKVSLCEDGYQELSLPLPRVINKSAQTSAMADSGAQITVAGMNLAHALATKLNAAGSNALGLIGGMLITITSQDEDGNNRETRQMSNVSEMIFTLFLSKQACEDLGILSEDFPSISSNSTTGNLASSGIPTSTCSCPARSSPPPPQHPCIYQPQQRTGKT